MGYIRVPTNVLSTKNMPDLASVSSKSNSTTIPPPLPANSSSPYVVAGMEWFHRVVPRIPNKSAQSIQHAWRKLHTSAIHDGAL
jgi:hypothetical protein